MGGKSKYNSKDVVRDIKKLKKQFLLGDTVVVYCFDTDQYEKNINHEAELNDILSYAKAEKAECVWFCHDVEEVFLGNSISKSEKKDAAMNFKKKYQIVDVYEKKLRGKRYLKGTTNILEIFDKYLCRKQKS